MESGFVEPDIASGESVPVSFEEATATGDAGTAAGGVANASARRDSSAAAAAAVMMADKTQTHLDDYAKIGLRTLCMAKRVRTAECRFVFGLTMTAHFFYWSVSHT